MREGDVAPDFELAASDGSTVSLGAFRGKKNVVLCFYPKNRIFGCPSKKVFRMAQNVVSSYPQITAAGSELFAISVDTAESQAEFVKKYGIPYLHLADPGKDACKIYAGLNMVGLAKRSTFVIDREGTIRRVFRDIDAERHGAEIAGFLESLNKVK